MSATKPEPLTIVPPPEWRTLVASATGDSSWFAVRHDGDVCHVLITGEVNGSDYKTLSDEIGESKNIFLIVVNCTGGDANFAHAFYDCYRGRVVQTEIIGNCFSAGFVFALTGIKIVGFIDAVILAHEPETCVYGPAKELMLAGLQLQRTKEKLFQVIKLRCEQPDEIVNSWLDGADVYFTAEQAKAYGLIDEICYAPSPSVSDEAIQRMKAVSASKASGRPAPKPYTPSEEFLLQSLLPAAELETRDKARLRRDLNMIIDNVKEIE